MNNLNNAKIFDLIASNNFFEIIEEISQHGTVIKAALSAIRKSLKTFFILIKQLRLDLMKLLN